MRIAELDMHPLDTSDRQVAAQDSQRHRAVQHHQVLHRGLPGAHPHHRQRDHPAQGAGGRPQVRPAAVLAPPALTRGDRPAGSAPGPGSAPAPSWAAARSARAAGPISPMPGSRVR
jgi:hypothetical protein